MQKEAQFYQEYIASLDQFIQQINEQGKAAQTSGDQKGFVMSKVKANVADVFQKMCHLSYTNVFDKLKVPDLAKHIEQYDEKHQQFYAAYLSFFEKIPAPWKEKAAKDQKFGKQEEYEKELAKLQIVDEIKELFISHYNRTFGVE